MEFKNKYYLIQSGEILKAAEQYRNAILEYHYSVNNFLKECGAVTGQTSYNGKFFSLKFEDGKVPKNFKKPNSFGCAEPFSDNKEWVEKLKNSPALPDILDYIEGKIEIVNFLNYEGDQGKGGICVGNPFKPIQIFFFSKDSPLLLVVPDVEYYVKLKEDEGYTITSEKTHRLPEGIKEVLKEEWDLMVAKHKQKDTDNDE